MTTIILVRHGENEWVKQHRLAGWIEGVHLNENGHSQAKAAAERLAHLPITAVYSSPVIRCVETAKYIGNALDKELILLEEVGEVRYGDWEGAEIKKLAEKPEWKVVQFFPSRMRFPNGEALREVQFRAIQALEKLAETHGDEMLVVTSHADLIKLVLAHFLGVHIDLFQRIVVSPASISVVNLSDKGMMRILRLNDTGPLEAPKKPEPKEEEKKEAE